MLDIVIIIILDIIIIIITLSLFFSLPLYGVTSFSGLYPQVAIGDECNSFKKGSEQIFHTKVCYSSFPLY